MPFWSCKPTASQQSSKEKWSARCDFFRLLYCALSVSLLFYLVYLNFAGFIQHQFVDDIHIRYICRFYENLAVGVLSECYSSDQYKATLLVVHQMINYGCVTPLQLAVLADNKNFVAHPVCQNVLTTVWFGRLQNDNSHLYLKVMPWHLCFFFTARQHSLLCRALY